MVRAGAVLAVALGASSPALGDGLPVLGIDVGSTGVLGENGRERFVTIPAGSRTVVARVASSGGRIDASTAIAGRFTVPAVAYDGSAAGLSGDGRTLVVIEPRTAFPRVSTRFAVLDARRLYRSPTIVGLRGDFSFDAVSPDGRFMYLIQYLSPRDPTRYRVRAYDLRAGRLLTGAVVDADEPTERMSGTPVTRATSPDGRWAYTLYQRPTASPFIHALDTATRRAHCVDLDALGVGVVPTGLRLSADGSDLSVVRGRVPLMAVDTATFATRDLLATRAEASTGGGGAGRAAWLGAAAGVLTLGALAGRRRGRSARSARSGDQTND